MRSYVILSNWTDQGVKNSRDTLKRANAFRTLIESRRGKVREHLYTLGEYDILTVAEFPDDETATAAALTLASLGNVRVKTLRAFTDGKRPRSLPNSADTATAPTSYRRPDLRERGSSRESRGGLRVYASKLLAWCLTFGFMRSGTPPGGTR